MFLNTRRRIANAIRSRFLITEAGGSAKITNANVKNFIVKFVGAISGDSTDYTSPEHDLSEVKDAVDTDSYLKVAILKYSQLITKNGYKITSVNENALAYVKQRIRMMEFGTGIPFDVLLDGIAHDLVQYSNAFLVKSRIKDTTALGGAKAVGILDKNPIGGYFRVDPSTVMIKRDKNGTIQGYQQEVDGEDTTFKTTDVVHLYTDKEAGNAFGTPRIVAAMEDVRLLRKLEGQVLSIVYRFSIPLYQAKIGVAKENMMATEQELKEAQSEIEKMPNDGFIVTNERTDFKVIGAEGQAIDISPYLNYFENRVFSALNVSQSMMGRGGAKQDADSMEQQVHDQVKFFQHTIETFLAVGMFNELLMEGGFDPLGNTDDAVILTFNEISLDTKVKLENNVVTKFQANLIEFEEARREMGYTSDNVDESRLFTNMITQPNAIAQIQAKMGGTTTSSSPDNRISNGKLTNATANKDAITKNQPTNQYGTTSAKIKENARDITESMSTELNFRQKYKDIHKTYESLRNNFTERTGLSRYDYNQYWNKIQNYLKTYVSDAAGRGALAYDLEHHLNNQYQPFEINKMESLIQDSIERLSNVIYKQIKKDDKSPRTVMDALEYRLRFTVEYVVSKAYWYGYSLEAKKNGASRLKIQFHSDDDKKEHNETVDLHHLSIYRIPPFHPYCRCSLKGVK